MDEVISQKPLRTYVAIVLDKSGSMKSRKAVTVSGFNEQIQTLIASGHKGGETFASLVLFDDSVSADFFNVPVFSLREMTEDAYMPNGGTAMRDAVGYTLDRFSSETDITDPNNAYLVIIISDGEENVSRYWSANRLKERMDELQSTNRWTFVYIGCNQDVLAVGKEYNLSVQNVCKGWTGDYESSNKMYKDLSISTNDYLSDRSCGKTSKVDFFK
jgi:uncharacterized protein YegL